MPLSEIVVLEYGTSSPVGRCSPSLHCREPQRTCLSKKGEKVFVKKGKER